MLKERKKINILLFAKSVDGGTGTVILNLQKLASNNFELQTVVLEAPSSRKIKQFIFTFLHKRNFYPQKYSFSIGTIKEFIREIIWFKKELKKYSPDVVISLDIHCNLIVVLAKLISTNGPKIILTTHISLKDTIHEKSTRFVRFFLSWAVSYLYNKADLLICLSHKMRASLRKEYGISGKIAVIHNGFSHSKSLEARKNKKNKIIISVGRLVEQKDFFTLIDAFERIRDVQRDVQLIIVGEGPMRNLIGKRIKSSTSASHIKLVGWQENIPLWIANSDIFVLSSKREGFPYVMLEALAVGKPIISSDVPYGPSEILGGGKYGILVSPGNSVELARRMQKLLESKTEYDYYAKKSKERAEYFTEEKMLVAYARNIRSLIRSKQ